MDTNRLHYFVVVGRTGSLSKAAEMLRLSPAAISKAMSLLEKEVGVKLLSHVGRGIQLTQDGNQLLERIEKILKELDSLKDVAERKSKNQRIRIGSFEVFSTYFLGPLMEKELNDTDLELYELVPGELEEAISIKKVDIGITYIPIPRVELDYLKVGSLRMGLFSISNHFEGIPIHELPFAVPITPLGTAPTKVQGLDGWPEHELPRFQKYRVTLMESALELCRRGLAVAYLPEFVVRLHNEVSAEPFRLRPLSVKGLGEQRQDIYLIKRKSDEEDRVMKRIAMALRRVAAK